MKTKRYLLGLSALALMLLVGASTVSAYQGDYTKKGPNYSEDRHLAMTQAFENLDYTTWSNLMNGKGRVTKVVTEENFAKFAEAHKLALSGNYAGADAIRAELGLRTRNGEGMGAEYRGGNEEAKGFGQGKGYGRNR